MSINRVWAPLLAFLLLFPLAKSLGAVPATHPVAHPTTQQIKGFVNALSNDDWKVRQKAMDDLTALGPLPEAELRAALKNNPEPGTASAIEALLRQIEEAARISPTLISLRLNSAKATDAAAAIAREGHIEFVSGVESLLADFPQPIDLSFDRMPMWQAVQELCSKTHLAFSEMDRSGQIVLIPVTKENPPPPLAIAGPFLLAVSRVEVTSSHVQNFAGRKPLNGRSSSDPTPGCHLFLFPYCESKLNAIHWFIDSIDESAADNGKIEPENPGWRSFGGGRMGSWTSEVKLGLRVPADAVKIARLKLMARFILQQEMQKLEVPDILTVKNSTHLLAGFRMVIAGVNKSGDERYSYQLTIYRDAHSDAEWSLMRSLIGSHGCKLVDADGQTLGGIGGSSSTGQDKFTTDNTLTRDKGNGIKTGEPVKLIWEIPSKTRQIIIPMEFHDIELPR